MPALPLSGPLVTPTAFAAPRRPIVSCGGLIDGSRNRTCTRCGQFLHAAFAAEAARQDKKSAHGTAQSRSFEEVLRSCGPQRIGSRRALQ